jgi:hypothetical protein
MRGGGVAAAGVFVGVDVDAEGAFPEAPVASEPLPGRSSEPAERPRLAGRLEFAAVAAAAPLAGAGAGGTGSVIFLSAAVASGSGLSGARLSRSFETPPTSGSVTGAAAI